MYNLCLIGNGKWGKNYVRTIKDYFPQCKLQIATKSNWKQLINLSPDGVIIATPPQSHIEIATYVLQRNIPVIIEKPLALSLSEAQTLQDYSAPIIVNHIHLFSETYQRMKSIILNNPIDNIKTIGHNCGPVRDYSALWDYAPHDLSMILDISQEMPLSTAIQEYQTKYGKLWNINLNFDTFSSSSLVGNGASKKRRYFSLQSNNITFSYEDKYTTIHSPLFNLLNVFLNAIYGYSDPRVGLNLSLKVLKILTDCQNLI